MAFSPAQKETLVGILGGDATTDLLTAHLTNLGAGLTAEKQTYIEAQITRWTTAGFAFIRIEPKESNFGARVDSDAEKNDIRGNIARSLAWPYNVGSASYGTLQLGV